MVDTIIECDTIVYVDTIPIKDTILYSDTIFIQDFIVKTDTIPYWDTIIRPDSLVLYDTIVWIDTLHWQHIQFQDSLYTITDTLLFQDILGGQVYPITAHFNDSSTMSYPVTFTNLPIVLLEGEFGYDYVEGFVTILSFDSVNASSPMSAKIKWRGGSTNGTNKHKRNYTIKFINEKGKKQKRQIMGMRTHNQWILNAGQVDHSRCRNQIGHELWHDFARKPYYYDQAPDTRTSIQGQFVEVFLNGEYRGLYSLTENVDQQQLQLVDHDEDNNIFHGQLWKTDSWDGTSMYDIQDYNDSLETYRGFETKYPDFEDVNPTDYSLLYDAIHFALTSDDYDFQQHVEMFFDVPVLIDYYLLINVLVAQDNNGKNMFWACHDKQVDRKLTVAVWDLDCTVGQGYNPSKPHPNAFGPEVDMRTQNLLKVIDRLYQIPYYADSIYNRYWELYQTHLNPDSLYARYEQYIQRFIRGGVAAREEKKWSRDSDIGGYELNLENELLFIEDWIYRRFVFLNAGEFYKEDTPTNVDNTLLPFDNQMYNLLGQPVAYPVSPGVYIQNGKKILITP